MSKVTNKFHLANNFYDDNVIMVKELRSQLKTDRVGTVLDTCHAEMAIMFYKSLLSCYAGTIPDLEFTMDNYFNINNKVVKLFHFSQTNGNGYHGMPFSEDCYDKLKEYVDLYYKYNNTAPITLEVAETDFLKCQGYAKSYRLMTKYF